MENTTILDKPNKRTYQKHKQGGKVSVVHFVNEKLKPKKNNAEVFPIYLRITVKRQTTNIKSILDILGLSKSYFESISKKSAINDIIEAESNLLKEYVAKSNFFEDEEFKISKISSVHSFFVDSVSQMFSSQYGKGLKNYIDDYLEELGIKAEIYELFSRDEVFFTTGFEDLLRDKTDTVISILSKLIPDFKINIEDNSIFLLHIINILKISYGQSYDDFNDSF